MKNLLIDIIKAPDYFRFHELIPTDTGLNNLPEYLLDIRTLALCSRVLNYIRHQVGFPISINSGFRSPEVNRAVGGVSKSRHLRGCAFDIRPTHKDENRYRELYHLLHDTPLSEYFEEIIPYRSKGFVHISIDKAYIMTMLLHLVADKSTRYYILDLL